MQNSLPLHCLTETTCMNDSFLTQAFAIGRKLATTHLKSFFDHYYRVTEAEKNYYLRNRPAVEYLYFFFKTVSSKFTSRSLILRVYVVNGFENYWLGTEPIASGLEFCVSERCLSSTFTVNYPMAWIFAQKAVGPRWPTQCITLNICSERRTLDRSL